MSETKFTKGPWYADKYGKIWRNVPSDLYEYGGKIAGDMPLAFVSKGWYEKDETPYPQQANANLIAAAPDMYEALKESCLDCLLEQDKDLCDFCYIGKALRKARGETNIETNSEEMKDNEKD